MSKNHVYTYVVLRYVHDVTTGEFANVGVVMHCPTFPFTKAKLRTTYRRLSGFFPGMSGKSFRRAMDHLQRGLDALSSPLNDIFAEPFKDAAAITKAVLPLDDSSLQWASLGGGITNDPNKTFEHLYQKLVASYDYAADHERRNDAEIWKLFSRELERRNVVDKLREVEIHSDLDSMTFKHAYKNGVWHCMEPLSFDLIDGESIRHKAHRIAGQMMALKDSSEDFKLYLLVGEPTHPSVCAYYKNALKILDAIPVEKSVYTEAQADLFSEDLAKEIRTHEALN